MMQQDRRSVPRLAVDTLNHLSGLLQSEFAVARAEFAEKVSQAVTGAALMVVAVVLLIPVAVVLLMAFAAWLAELGLRPSLAHACAGVAGLVVVGVLALAGKSKIKPANLAPKHTLHQLARDADAARRAL
jgi:uncharacterized membrane protein YqjE